MKYKKLVPSVWLVLTAVGIFLNRYFPKLASLFYSLLFVMSLLLILYWIIFLIRAYVRSKKLEGRD